MAPPDAGESSASCGYRVSGHEGGDSVRPSVDAMAEVHRVLVALSAGDVTARARSSGDETADATIRVLNEFARKLEGHEIVWEEPPPTRRRGPDTESVRDLASELLLANQELSRSNRELDQVAYIASHDLQEPLRMVASYAELLSQRYHGRLDERADKYIRYMTAGAVRMQGLLRDLLAYARIGKVSRPFGPIDANLILRDARDNLRVALQESGATLEWDTLPTVWADRGLLTQVFQNLIANAIKFRGETRAHIHVSAARDDDRWTFSVRDNGIGIDPRHAERVFMMFQRVNERGRYEGSGVGLAIAKKIVDTHHGDIWFEPSRERGTVFRFSIPDGRTRSDTGPDVDGRRPRSR